MFKNVIIIILLFMLGTLLINNNKNVDLIMDSAVSAKKMVGEGADYLHETFDRKFEVHDEETFKKEHGGREYKPEGSSTDGIEEHTFFEEPKP